jgi:hypothetical protein
MKNKYHTIDVTQPIQGRVVMTDQYWLCKDGDPTQAIFFGESAQCNRNKEIVERMLQYTRDRSDWDVEVVFFEVAYRPQPKKYHV